MDAVRISSIAQTVNNNLAYKADMLKRPNTIYLESTEDNCDNGSFSPHKKLCKDLQYNNNNNEYISDDSEESDSEAPNPYTATLGVSRKPLVTSQCSTLDPGHLGVELEPKEITPDRKKTKGRLKVEMKYLEDKLKRNTTFNKRKNGMLKKAYELSTLTGTEILVVIASEAGYIHTFATKKLQPVIASQQGQEFIQDCLMSEDDPEADTELSGGQETPQSGGVISKWKANKSRIPSVTLAQGQPVQSQVAPQVSPQTMVSSPLYGQAAKTEPIYEGVYGQMPSAQQYNTTVYDQAQDDKSSTNSSYSNLSPPPLTPTTTTTSILQGALSGTPNVENYVQYVTQSAISNNTVSATEKIPTPQTSAQQPSMPVQTASKPTSVHQPTDIQAAAYAYSLANSLAEFAAAAAASNTSRPNPQYNQVQNLVSTMSTSSSTTTQDNVQQPGTSTQETSPEYEFQTDPGKTVYIKVPVKEEPNEVGCYWS